MLIFTEGFSMLERSSSLQKIILFVLMSSFKDVDQKHGVTDDDDLGECAVCLEVMKLKLVMLVPCEHYLHENCFHRWKVVSLTCPNCRAPVKETIQFNYDFWESWETARVEMNFSQLSDQELENICLKEGIKLIIDAQRDPQTRWQRVRIKELNGESSYMKLPADMRCSQIKQILAAAYHTSFIQLRLVVQGCAACDDLTLSKYAPSLDTSITIHLVTKCTGS
jgi:hypothetical protein